MFNSFWKVLPVLTLGLGIGAQADTVVAQQQAPKAKPMMQSAMPCGVVENDCYARSCMDAKGGALQFDFLWWRAENRGYDVAYQQKYPNFTAAILPTNNNGSIVRPSTKWDPGFRLGAGWNTDFDRWDVYANWTWFKDKTFKKHYITSPATGQGFYSMLGVDEGSTSYGLAPYSFQGVKGSWKMWYNNFDLELGRAFYITKALSLRPNFGLRGGWLNQRFKTALTTSLTGSPSLSEMDFSGKNNFWGIGPRVGVESNWHIANSSWSILGKASTALLAGKTKVAYLTQNKAITTLLVTTQRNFKDHFSQVVPAMQLFLGLDWGSCLDCNRYYLGVNAGWETNIYWDQFNIPGTVKQIVAPISGSNNLPVTMEGLTASIHLDF